jgi:hypothetical protein
MQTSRIHIDEFICGYRGRLRAFNLFRGSKYNFMHALHKEMHPPETPLNECPAAVTLALAAGMPIQQFVQNHSLLPYHNFISMKDYDVDHGDPSRLSLIINLGTRVWRQSEAWLCLDCIKEDIVNSGYAYWRRSHQLPGIYWCNQHGAQLLIRPVEV